MTMRLYPLMRVAGIRIVVDPTWLFVFALVVVSLSGDYLPAAAPHLGVVATWTLGVIAALLLFTSVLVHELSHALMARRAGIRVPRIRLFLFGGVAEMAAEAHEPRAELRIAMAGPLTSLVVAGAATFAVRLIAGAGPVWLLVLLRYVAMANLFLGLFNLLPGLPLDGGRILRAWLWSRHGNLLRATRSAGRGGAIIGFTFMGLGLALLAVQAFISGLWLIVLGFFINRAASASYETALLRDTLRGVHVRQLMVRDVVGVPDHISLEEMVAEIVTRRPHRVYPVMREAQMTGLIGIDQVRRVPRDEWIRVPVRQVMTPAALVPPAGPEEECVAALERMLRDDLMLLPVATEGRIIGVLSRRDILEHYHIRSTLAAR
jgi:Zn-dependent protease/CBS domain-containing protein